MAKPTIPERQPTADPFTGWIVRVDGEEALATERPAGAEIVAEGVFTVRYAVRMLGKPHIAIVPGLVAIDYGTMLTGEEAWEFVMKRSNLYPRAEVFGWRNDGREDMLYVKQLDLALPVQVLVYPNDAAFQPIASPTRLIAKPDDDSVAPRLRGYLETT